MPQPSDHLSTRSPKRTVRDAALALVLALVWSGSNASAPYAGRTLDDVLREFSARGVQLIYNQDLVPPDLRVGREPTPGSEEDVLGQLLAEQGLQAKRVGDGIYAVVRRDASTPAAAAVSAPPATPLEDIVVTASRYSLAADLPDVHTFLTQTEVAAMPRFADDALKAVHRLPGAASNGLSGLAHMRGGEENETQVIFDGLPLYEPFHLRLLQSPTSVLDERAIESMDVYAGGFTAEYGDRMSAIIDARSVHPAEDAHYELGLSTFHANALAARRFDDGRGQWLAAVRASNLDLTADMIDFDLGEPKYFDAQGRVDYAFSDDTRGSLHVLAAGDRVQVTNRQGTETANARYQNFYAWGTLEHEWTPRLHGSALLSFTDVSSERDGTVDEPDRRTGEFDDQRDYDVAGLKLDGSYTADRALFRFGAEARSLRARYEYTGNISFSDGYPFPDSPARDDRPRPFAATFGAALRGLPHQPLPATDRLTAEVGLRWDEESYTPDVDNELGPRVNLALRPRAAGLDCARAGGGTSSSRASRNCRSRTASTSSSRRSMPITQSSDSSTTSTAASRCASRPTARTTGGVRTRYESLFDPLSLAPELRWDRVAISPQSARAEGAEWLVTRKSDGPWSGWFSYAWSQVEDRAQGLDTLRSWDQTHSVQGGLTWADQRWKATLAGSYHTGWPVTPVGVVQGVNGQTVVLGPRNTAHYADFAAVDLRVSRDFPVKYGALNVYAEVTNMLDRHNQCCVDYEFGQEDGGDVVIDREFRHWLPLVPAFGVLWTF